MKMYYLMSFNESSQDGDIQYLKDIFQEKIDDGFTFNINKKTSMRLIDYKDITFTRLPEGVDYKTIKYYGIVECKITCIDLFRLFNFSIFINEIEHILNYLEEYKLDIVLHKIKGSMVLSYDYDHIEKFTNNDDFLNIDLIFYKRRILI